MTATARSIAVTGTGSAEAAPDLLTLSIGVECRRAGVDAAYRDAGLAAAAITGALRDHRIPDSDIGTAGLSIRAEVGWQEGHGQIVSGYLASSTLRVLLRDLAGSAAVIADAVKAGGDDARLHGIELDFADPADVQARARQAAWDDARTQAEHFAALAGARLGTVMSVTQQSASRPAVPLVPLQRTAASEPLTVEAGSTGVSTAVGVVWELLD